MLEAGRELGPGKDAAVRLLNAQTERIERAASEVLAEIETENAQLLETRPALAATFSGVQRCVRAVLEVVIKNMVAQID